MEGEGEARRKDIDINMRRSMVDFHLGCKRSFLEDRPHSKITKDDDRSIYESTLQKLRYGAGVAMSWSEDAQPKVSGQKSSIADTTFINWGSTSSPCAMKSKPKESRCLCSLQSQGRTCSSCSFSNQYNHAYCLESNLQEGRKP